MKVIIAIVLLVFIIAGFIFLQIKNKKKLTRQRGRHPCCPLRTLRSFYEQT